MTVTALTRYLTRQCTGTRTSGCVCPTCVLVVDITYYADRYARRIEEARANIIDDPDIDDEPPYGTFPDER